MLGRSILAGNTAVDSRMFIYEVAGLHENDQTAQNQAAIRHSSTVLIPVPFSRMNEFMQRMNRLGGTIVGIRSAADGAAVSPAAPSDESSTD